MSLPLNIFGNVINEVIFLFRLWVLTCDVIKHLVQIVGNVRSIAENLPDPSKLVNLITDNLKVLHRGDVKMSNWF